MKMLAAITLICTILIVFPAFTAPAPFESCFCSADDGSCSASATCSGGCLAFCPSNGCRAMCTDGDGGGYSLMYSVSLHFKGSNAKVVSAELSRVSGQEVVFTPSTADATVNLDVDNVPLWDALEILSKSGRILIGQDDFSNLRTVRRALLYGERMSVSVHGVTVKRLVKELRYLTGLDIRVTSGDEKRAVSFTAQGVNFYDIITQASEQAGVQIDVK